MKRIFKYLVIILVVVLLLMLFIWIALQNATVQSKVADYFTNRLSKQYNTEISVGDVDIDFFKTIHVSEVLVKDLQKDTLLYAGSLKSEISLFSLVGQKFHLDNIHLEDAYINLYEKDAKANYDFLLGSKSSDSNKEYTSSKSKDGWDIDIKHFSIENTQLRYDFSDLKINSKLKDLSIDINSFDTANKNLEVDKFDLNDSDLSITQIPNKTNSRTETLFPSIPYAVSVEQFSTSNTRFELKEKGYSSSKDQLDFKNLRLNISDIDINDLKLSPSLIEAEVNKMSLRDDSGARLTNFKTQIVFTPKKLSLKKLDLRMPQSRVKGSIDLKYKKFQDLVDFDRSMHSSINLSWAKVGVKDLHALKSLTSLDVSQINSSTKLIAKGNIVIEGKKSFKFYNLKSNLSDAVKGTLNGELHLMEDLGLSTVNLSIQDGYLSTDELKNVIPELDLPEVISEQGAYNFNTELHGKVNDLTITALTANTTLGSKVNASGQLSGIYSNDIKYDLLVHKLETNIANIKSIDLPKQASSLGKVVYKGKIKGTKTLFDLDGLLQTEQGNIEADVILDFNDQYDNLTYKGNVVLQQVHLDKIMDDDSYGLVDLNLDLDGKGMSVEELKSSVKGKINDFTYKGKRYQNITVDGTLDGLGYDGKIKIQDKDLNLDYDGRFAYNDQAPILDFKMNMDSLNLASLNLGLGDYKVTGTVDSKLRGQNLDDVTGTFLLDDFIIEKNGKTLESKDSILLKITDNPDQTRTAVIKSPYADATVTGNIQYTEVANALANIFDAYFEIPGFKPEPIDGRHRFDIDLKSDNLNPLLEFYDQDFRVKDIALKGEMDTKNQIIKFTGAIDSLAYKNYWTEHTTLGIHGENTQMLYALKFNNVHDKDRVLSEVSLINGDIYDKILNVFVDLREKKDASTLEIGAQLIQDGDEIAINIGESLTINDDIWSISKDNDLVIGDGNFIIDNLKIFKDQQGISISNDKDDINISFEDFELMELLGLVGKDEFEYHGKINGDVVVNDLMSDLYVTSKLKVDSLSYDDIVIGDVTLEANQNKDGKSVDANFSVFGDENDGLGEVTYFMDTNKIDGFIEFGQLEMRLIDPFLSEIISDSKGHLYGEVKFDGTIDSPDAKGRLLFDNASTVVNFNQTRYRIKKNAIKFNKKIIELGNISLLDDNDNQAILSGAIIHNSFKDMFLDVRGTSKGVKFLNTTSKDNPLFYGKVYLDADMHITGKTDNLKLYAHATAVNNSYLALSPFSNVETSIKDDYIVYGNPDSIRLNTKVEDFVKTDAFPLDVDMNLIVNDDAKFEFIVDPIKGDKLQAFGNANLNLKLKKEGDILLYGKYLADRGFYSFTYGLIEKRFAIDKGGTVSFEGDPLEARLDIDAIYKTKANLYDLVQSEIDEEGIAARNRRSEVNVELGLRGKILKPEISLDINIPDRNTPLYEEAEQKLASLRTNTNQLNNQVFGLLLFDNFVISSNEVSTDLSNVGEDFVLGSVSTLLSSQLNKIASGLIKGVELNVDVNNYASKYSQNAGLVTELDFGVTKRLLDDRLTLKAGGNFNIESNTAQTEFSSLAGDFIIEYILNDKGNYILKVYNSSDYNILVDQNTRKSGVGIILKKNLD